MAHSTACASTESCDLLLLHHHPSRLWYPWLRILNFFAATRKSTAHPQNHFVSKGNHIKWSNQFEVTVLLLMDLLHAASFWNVSFYRRHNHTYVSVIQFCGAYNKCHSTWKCYSLPFSYLRMYIIIMMFWKLILFSKHPCLPLLPVLTARTSRKAASWLPLRPFYPMIRGLREQNKLSASLVTDFTFEWGKLSIAGLIYTDT